MQFPESLYISERPLCGTMILLTSVIIIHIIQDSVISTEDIYYFHYKE